MNEWPDLTALELLVALADHGSLSAGARAIDTAQPNARRVVARLEQAWVSHSWCVRPPDPDATRQEGSLRVKDRAGVIIEAPSTAGPVEVNERPELSCVEDEGCDPDGT